MDNYAIWAIGLGVLILLFEAYKEYSTADAVGHLKSNNQSSRKELENVRMTALTTKAENRRGLFIYMLMFLGLYAAILISPELISVFVSTSKPDDAFSGGTSHLARSIVNTGDGSVDRAPITDPRTLPFWLALAITLGATSPTFQAVERKVRAVAYFFAGVPRNIFRVLQSLEDLNYSEFGDDTKLPLLQAFHERLAETPTDPILRGTIDSIESALRCIDLLQGPIIGLHRATFRQLFNDETPLARIDDLSARYTRIRGSIRDLVPDDAALNELYDDTIGLADSMQCLFALYAIRSRKVPESLQGTPTAAIIKKVTDDTTAQPLHDIALASFFAAVFSYLAVELVALNSSDSTKADKTEAVRDFCADLLIPLIPAIVVLAFLTILFRHLKIDQGSWPKNQLGQVPFWDYARLAFMPAISATTLYGVLTCLTVDGVWRPIWEGEFQEAIRVSAAFLNDEINQLPRVLLMSFVASCGLLFIADQHDGLRWYVTVGAAVVVSGFLWMTAKLAASVFKIAAPGAGLEVDDVAIMITLPFAILLVLYACAAEMAETASVKRAISAVATPFRQPQSRG